MKKAVSILLSVIFALFMISLSLAEEEKKAESSTTPELRKLTKASKVQQITGGVSAVNTITNSITVTKKIRDKAVEAVVTIDDQTKIMKENKNKSFADIKMGDKVVVKYTKVDGKNIAKSISIKPSEPESKEKEIKKQGKPAKKK